MRLSAAAAVAGNIGLLGCSTQIDSFERHDVTGRHLHTYQQRQKVITLAGRCTLFWRPLWRERHRQQQQQQQP